LREREKQNQQLVYYQETQKQKGLQNNIMDKWEIGRLYLLACLYNLHIILFSKFFSNDLGSVDPLFQKEGCFLIVLWGLAYASVSNIVDRCYLLSLVFALEKIFYSIRWMMVIQTRYVHCYYDYQNKQCILTDKLLGYFHDDPMTEIFFMSYGIGDVVFGLLFFYSAIKYWNVENKNKNNIQKHDYEPSSTTDNKIIITDETKKSK